MTKSVKKLKTALYLRNFIFGVEDSLVSTVGLLSGVAVANVDQATIFLTGMVLIFVEAFSMGVGSFLSESFVAEYQNHKDGLNLQSVSDAIIMSVSYFLAGFIPLSPYIFLPKNQAFPISIAASLIALFFLGFIAAFIFKVHILKNALRMLFVGGIAIISGILIGLLVHS